MRSCPGMFAGTSRPWSRIPATSLALSAGRSLHDLSTLADVPGLIHAGNHGMEIRGPGLEFTHPGATAAKETLDLVGAMLEDALATVPGTNVEHKGLTLTVHYRAAGEDMAGEVDAVATRTTAPFVQDGKLRLTKGRW